jgi:outer membrane protein
MKIILRTILLLFFLAFGGGSALAQTKIATVDLPKLFENYYKTKLAQAAIQDHATQLDKDDKSMKDDLKKATDEYQQLLTQAKDQAISGAERDRRNQAAADKLKQLKERSAAIDEYERQAQATLNGQKMQMREKILAAIQAVVNTTAKAGGYTLVIDKSAQAASVTPVLVYSVPEIDLTADVLKQLNAGAPIDITSPSSAPVVLPVPSLLNTNSP